MTVEILPQTTISGSQAAHDGGYPYVVLPTPDVQAGDIWIVQIGIIAEQTGGPNYGLVDCDTPNEIAYTVGSSYPCPPWSKIQDTIGYNAAASQRFSSYTHVQYIRTSGEAANVNAAIHRWICRQGYTSFGPTPGYILTDACTYHFTSVIARGVTYYGDDGISSANPYVAGAARGWDGNYLCPLAEGEAMLPIFSVITWGNGNPSGLTPAVWPLLDQTTGAYSTINQISQGGVQSTLLTHLPPVAGIPPITGAEELPFVHVTLATSVTDTALQPTESHLSGLQLRVLAADYIVPPPVYNPNGEDLILDGVAFFTERGSLIRQYAGIFVPPTHERRTFTVTALVETEEQRDWLDTVLEGFPIEVQLPDGTSVAQALVSNESRTYVGDDPYMVDLTILEL